MIYLLEGALGLCSISVPKCSELPAPSLRHVPSPGCDGGAVLES